MNLELHEHEWCNVIGSWIYNNTAYVNNIDNFIF